MSHSTDPSMAEPKNYITSQQLKYHNKAGDLWISIQGKVYDVSDWVHHHPGGATPLFTLAGQDVTDAFLACHPPSSWNYLCKFSKGHYLDDYSVSDASADYRRLAAEFSNMGLFENKGHLVAAAFSVITIMFFINLYGVLCCDSTWVHLLCGGLMGVIWIQSGWLGHDSSHYQIMPNRKLNQFVQILTGNCLAGISIGWWKWNHNAHHITCNSLDFDPDLQHIPFLAVSNKFFSSLKSRFYGRELKFDTMSTFLISYQHLTYYPVMCFARLNLFAQSFFLLLSDRKVPARGVEILGVIVFWVWYPLLVSCLPNWWEKIMFVAASFIVTGIQHVQFTLNHFSGEVYVGAPAANDWCKIQTRGTIDISCPSWMDWFHGGLQFQIEHHLFPRMPRGQLRKISPFVKELCKKHNLPYKMVSFFEANELTLKTLKKAAMQARDLSNPARKNLVWEAVNTFG